MHQTEAPIFLGNKKISGTLVVGATTGSPPAGGALFTGAIRVPGGAANAPAVQVGSGTTGFYSVTPGSDVALTIGNTLAHYYNGSSYRVRHDSGIHFWGASDDVSLRRLAAGALARTEAIPANANYGALSIGSGPFDGSTAGFFAGSASGTALAVNAASGFVGDLLMLQVAGVPRLRVAAGSGFYDVIGQPISGGAITWRATPGAHTAVVSEITDFVFNAHTMTITGGYATQRHALFNQPTITAGSVLTVASAATVAIAGAPIQAGSALITNAYALWVQAGLSRFDGSVGHTGTTYKTGSSEIAWTNSLTVISRNGRITAADPTRGGLYFGAVTDALPSMSGERIAFEFAGDNFTATAGFTTQRATVFSIPTFTASSTTKTITNYATVAIAGAPTASGTGVITNPYALWVQGGNIRHDGARAFIGAAASAPADADLQNSQISAYLDEAGANLKIKVKYSNGTIKTGTVALV